MLWPARWSCCSADTVADFATTLRRDRQQRSTGSRKSLNQTGYVGTSLAIKAIKSFKAVAKGVEVHHVAGGESRAEFDIFGTQGNCLGDPEIVDFEAPCHHSVGVWRLISDETVLPSTGKNCGGLGDALGIVAVGLMEHRRFTNRPVYEVSLFVVGVIQRRNISLY